MAKAIKYKLIRFLAEEIQKAHKDKDENREESAYWDGKINGLARAVNLAEQLTVQEKK